MKNQYFGDINDYRKYGLLRSIQSVTKFRTLIAWMLTPDDSSSDGKYISYLDKPEKWSHFDPELYDKIQQSLYEEPRAVKLIENSTLLPGCEFFSQLVPDHGKQRANWFKELSNHAHKNDFIFLDPDNGIEVKSRPYGKKHSNKFLFWHEVETLWQSGKSLMIYQHFIRQKREDFIQRMLGELESKTAGSLVEAFSTPRVLFLLALQPSHRHYHQNIVERVQKSWAGQIRNWDLIK